ncbi:rRNA methyltransferase [Lachnellula suecica]|uniref:rRNA methyltransferase 1, mitochondrial n=1 Tax=Lachnellula suecica TaxID=602035 RepID=A0A8T9BYA4_9HELO|nr:rRNA methyltransferase [Lachnellula suecica]
MIKTALSRNIRHSRALILPLQLSFHSSSAKSSVNTAIARGLRKSKGVGFRGRDAPVEKRWGREDKPVERNGPVRRTAEVRNFQPHGPQMTQGARKGKPSTPQTTTTTREGWPGKPSKHRGSSAKPELRIRRGDKPVKSDEQLARKKPNPAGSSRYGSRSFGDRAARTQAVFDEEAGSDNRMKGDSNRTGFQGRGAFDRRTTQRPELDTRAASPSFGDRGNKRASNSDTYGANDQPASRTKYPSLSFGNPKFTKQREEPDSSRQTSAGRRAPRSGENYSERQRESPYTGRSSEPQRQEPEPTYRQRQSSSSERKGFEGRRQESDSADAYTQPKFAKRYDSGADSTQSSGPFTMGKGRVDIAGKSDDDSSTVRTRFTKTPDNRIPLSIPYTTPASEFLYGTSVVEAALKSRRVPRRQHYKLYIYTGDHREKVDRDADIERLARKNQVEIVKMNNDGLRLMDKMSTGRPHNGYILEASPLPRLPITSLGELASEDGQTGFEVTIDYQSREDAAVNGTSTFAKTSKYRDGRKPMVLFLDGVVDPGNLGGIIRTASFLGVSAVATSTRNSAPFSPVVLKSSAGASEHITLFSVSKPDSFIHNSKQAGWKVYAAVAPSTDRSSKGRVSSVSTENLLHPLLDDPCILMLGAEGDGLRQNLREKADVELYIPGSGQSHTVDSLNVSVAAGILCNAFLGKSKKDGVLSIDHEDPQDGESSERIF